MPEKILRVLDRRSAESGEDWRIAQEYYRRAQMLGSSRYTEQMLSMDIIPRSWSIDCPPAELTVFGWQINEVFGTWAQAEFTERAVGD